MEGLFGADITNLRPILLEIVWATQEPIEIEFSEKVVGSAALMCIASQTQVNGYIYWFTERILQNIPSTERRVLRN